MVTLDWLQGAQMKCFYTVFLRVSVSMLPDEIRAVKADCPPTWRRASSTLVRAWKRTREGRRSNSPLFCFLLVCLSWDISSSLAFGLGLKPLAPWFSGLQTQTKLHHWLSWAPACRKQIRGLFSLHNHASQYVIISFYIVIYL